MERVIRLAFSSRFPSGADFVFASFPGGASHPALATGFHASVVAGGAELSSTQEPGPRQSGASDSAGLPFGWARVREPEVSGKSSFA